MPSGRRGQIKRVDGRRRASTDVDARRATDVDGRRRAWCEWAFTCHHSPEQIYEPNTAKQSYHTIYKILQVHRDGDLKNSGTFSDAATKH